MIKVSTGLVYDESTLSGLQMASFLFFFFIFFLSFFLFFFFFFRIWLIYKVVSVSAAQQRELVSLF